MGLTLDLKIHTAGDRHSQGSQALLIDLSQRLSGSLASNVVTVHEALAKFIGIRTYLIGI